MKHFLTIDEHSPEWLGHVLRVGRELREQREKGQAHDRILSGRTLAMFFEKPSLRTRVSFEQAMVELGGHAIVLGQQEVQLGQRESVGDFAQVVSGMVHGIAARVFEHSHLEQMAACGTVPVINMLSDKAHPCQALADVMTLQDEFDHDIADRTLTFVGDGNNVARSLAALCQRLSARFVLSSPAQYRLDEPDLPFEWVEDPIQAVAEADAVYCDTFVSMGQEDEKQQRLDAFAAYQVNAKLMAAAPSHAIVLHCLPAYRNVEITDEVMDGPQSRVFNQSHNRLHAQKGLLAVMMGEGICEL